MVLSLGALLMLVGVIWMIYLAVTNEMTTGMKVVWAVLIILFGPLAATIYLLLKRIGLIPVILMWIAVIFYGYGVFTSMSDVMNQM